MEQLTEPVELPDELALDFDLDADQDSDEQLYRQVAFKVDAGQSLLRIDKFLNNRMDKASRTKIQDAARAGCVLVNGKTVKPNYKVRPHDDILVLLPRPVQAYSLEPEAMDLVVVYEDDDLMVINKPAGLVVHPGCGHNTGTLVHGLLHHFKQLPAGISNAVIDGEQRPGLVHRIDKNTSGLMVIAKNDYAMSHLARQFFYHTVQRRYVALVWGDFDQDEGTITGNLDRHARFRKIMDVYPDGERGKHAITHYRVLERLGYVTLVECRLETGRTHQIRVHFQHIGHPLFNDPEYGGNRIIKGTVYTKYRQFVDNCFDMLPRQALHAQILGFEHPTSGKNLQFEAVLPDDMKQLIDKWRKYMAFSGKFEQVNEQA